MNSSSQRHKKMPPRRSLWIWIGVGTFFVLLLLQLQNLTIVVETQDTMSNEKEDQWKVDQLVALRTPTEASGEEEQRLDASEVAALENTGAAHTSPRQHGVRFIPYPHRTLGSGTFVQCQWTTGRMLNASSELLDFTQRNAYTEGVCIPPTLKNTLHIFSSAEAIECLSPAVQKRDIKVMLSGDSYMKQLYIGLSDILLSKQSSGDKEIRNSVERNKVLLNAEHWMGNRRQNNSSFPFVQYRCEEECYGKRALERCSECMDNFSGNNRTDVVWFVGFAIHNYIRVKHRVDVVVKEINQFLDAEGGKNRTIYVGSPYYVPHENYTDQNVNMESVYRGVLPNLAPENPAHPFLDVFELTKSCVMENCSIDGNHRTRFVNRWKAQLLLNTLCEVQ